MALKTKQKYVETTAETFNCHGSCQSLRFSILGAIKIQKHWHMNNIFDNQSSLVDQKRLANLCFRRDLCEP